MSPEIITANTNGTFSETTAGSSDILMLKSSPPLKTTMNSNIENKDPQLSHTFDQPQLQYSQSSPKRSSQLNGNNNHNHNHINHNNDNRLNTNNLDYQIHSDDDGDDGMSSIVMVHKQHLLIPIDSSDNNDKLNDPDNEHIDYPDHIDFTCGVGGWRPRWLQHFANKQCFLALFCLTSVLQGIYYTYFVSVLTTIEKLYQIPSKTTGMIMSSTEVGQISGALLLTYYGGKGHRPKWISTGMLVFAIAALLCSTPHYLFGTNVQLTDNNNNRITTNNNVILDDWPSLSTPSTTTALNLCSIDGNINNLPILNASSLSLSSATNKRAYDLYNHQTNRLCQESELIVRKDMIINTVKGLFFISLLFIGLGTTAVNTLGIPYIDDNVAPKKSPLYFGMQFFLNLF